MKCANCNNPAYTCVNWIANGETAHANLCQDCGGKIQQWASVTDSMIRIEPLAADAIHRRSLAANRDDKAAMA